MPNKRVIKTKPKLSYLIPIPYLTDRITNEFNLNKQRICRDYPLHMHRSIMKYMIRHDSSFCDGHGEFPAFDSKAFTIPRSDIVNYFLWRIKDCRRNSINGYAQSIYSRKELQGKKCEDVLEMLRDKNQP